jgi:membrane-bound metal-dependent hydrolase YbcI (DUF457 family)
VANFKTHFVTTALASGALSSAFLTLEMFDKSQAMVAFAVGTLAGLAPDVDADNSKPLNIAFTVIAIIISFFTMFAQAGSLSIVEMLLFWLFVFFIVRFVFMLVFQMLTKHRGIFHSIPMALFLSQITVLIFHYFYQVPAHIAYLYAVFFLFGYVLHFLLDELVSVNLFGLYVKRSLGTALKFFDKETPILYLLLYFGTISLWFFLPEIESFLATFEKMQNFFAIWFPQEGWFQNVF